METIWKFTLGTIGEQNVTMPKGAEILTVQIQFGEPILWVRVNTDNEKESRHIIIYGTGHPVDTDLDIKYIGTYQLLGGNFIGHVFEKIKYEKQ